MRPQRFTSLKREFIKNEHKLTDEMKLKISLLGLNENLAMYYFTNRVAIGRKDITVEEFKEKVCLYAADKGGFIIDGYYDPSDSIHKETYDTVLKALENNIILDNDNFEFIDDLIVISNYVDHTKIYSSWLYDLRYELTIKELEHLRLFNTAILDKLLFSSSDLSLLKEIIHNNIETDVFTYPIQHYDVKQFVIVIKSIIEGVSLVDLDPIQYDDSLMQKELIKRTNAGEKL